MSILNLPDSSGIKNWMTDVDTETDILLDVLTEIGKFETNDCCLVIDSMNIKKKFIGIEQIIGLLYFISSYNFFCQNIIYYTPDACNNIKLARNALGSFNAFLDENDNLID